MSDVNLWVRIGAVDLFTPAMREIARAFGVPVRMLRSPHAAYHARRLRRSYRDDPQRTRARRIHTRPAKWRRR